MDYIAALLITSDMVPGGCYNVAIYSFVVLGMVSGVLAVLVFLFRKKLPRKLYSVLKIFLIIVFVLYSFGYRREPCGGRYSSGSTNYEIIFFPSDFIPF
jgi:hypothetical protein